MIGNRLQPDRKGKEWIVSVKCVRESKKKGKTETREGKEAVFLVLAKTLEGLQIGIGFSSKI